MTRKNLCSIEIRKGVMYTVEIERVIGSMMAFLRLG
jgi:hypothetical protein